MTRIAQGTGTSPFAHLLAGAAALALGRRGTRADTPDTDPDAEDPDQDPDAEDPDQDPDAETPDNDPDAEDPDNDPDADDGGDDPDAEEPEDKKEAKGFRAGRTAERKRCRAIFASPAAAGQPHLAAQLAFDTRMSAKEALGVLSAASAGAPARGRRSLDDRMGNRTDARPSADGGAGAGGAPGKGGALAQRMIAVGKRLGQVARD
jgi:hypothetical protein